MDRAEQFSSISGRQVKKVPLLRGKTIMNLFFENSTRTQHHLRACGKTALSRCHEPQHQRRPPPQKVKACLIPCTTYKPCTPTCLSSGIAKVAQQSSLPSTLPRTSVSSTPAMAVTPTRPKPCSTCLPSDATSSISLISASPLSATFSIHASPDHRSTPSPHSVSVKFASSRPKTLLPSRQLKPLGVHVYHDMAAGLQDVDVIITLTPPV